MSKRDPYITKSFRKLGSSGSRKLKKLVAQGWEIVSSAPVGASGVTVYTVRKPNPKYRGAK